MKQWIYPLLIVFAASSYGILSTIIKLAIQDGFTAAEAVTSQYFIGFFIALLFLSSSDIKSRNSAGALRFSLQVYLPQRPGQYMDRRLNICPLHWRLSCCSNSLGLECCSTVSLSGAYRKRIEVISLLFLFGGTILAAGIIDADLSGIPWQGWAWGMASAISFASFVMINQRQVKGMDTETRLLFTSFFAAIAIFFFQTPEIVWNGTLFGRGLWIYGLILGLFGIVIPIYLFSIAVPKVGTATASILSAMEFPVAVTASVILLSETLTVLQVVGIIVILFGMTLPTIVQRRLKYKE